MPHVSRGRLTLFDVVRDSLAESQLQRVMRGAKHPRAVQSGGAGPADDNPQLAENENGDVTITIGADNRVCLKYDTLLDTQGDPKVIPFVCINNQTYVVFIHSSLAMTDDHIGVKYVIQNDNTSTQSELFNALPDTFPATQPDSGRVVYIRFFQRAEEVNAYAVGKELKIADYPFSP